MCGQRGALQHWNCGLDGRGLCWTTITPSGIGYTPQGVEGLTHSLEETVRGSVVIKILRRRRALCGCLVIIVGPGIYAVCRSRITSIHVLSGKG